MAPLSFLKSNSTTNNANNTNNNGANSNGQFSSRSDSPTALDPATSLAPPSSFPRNTLTPSPTPPGYTLESTASTSTPSKYNPTRFLRRKPSGAGKAQNHDLPSSNASTNESPAPRSNLFSRTITGRNRTQAASRANGIPGDGISAAADDISSSEFDTEEPRTASSVFFSDIGAREGAAGGEETNLEQGYASLDEVGQVTPNIGSGTGLGSGWGMPARRGSDVSQDSNPVGSGRKAGHGRTAVHRSPANKREAGFWHDEAGNALFGIDRGVTGGGGDTPPPPPAWLSDVQVNATPSPSPASRRIFDPSQLPLPPSSSRLLSAASARIRPPSPPLPTLGVGISPDHPFYPTALSPPRRPMPRSPRAGKSSPPPATMSTSNSFSVFPPHHSHNGAHRASPSLDGDTRPTLLKANSLDIGPNTAELSGEGAETKTAAVSAEWLARKPSFSGKLRRKNSLGAERIKMLSSPSSGLRRRGSDRESTAASRPMTASSSTTTATDSDGQSQGPGQDSDAEIGTGIGTRFGNGIVGKRRSVTSRDGYEVEVRCDDETWDEMGEGEMKWEVVIRRRPKTNGTPGAFVPASPLQLSTSRSLATAPGTASSINLSLSLDQPTGKLVFIAFPMDLHATPKRRPSTSAASSSKPRVLPSSHTIPSTPPRTSSPSSSPRLSSRQERVFDPSNNILSAEPPSSPIRPPTPPRPSARPSTPPPSSEPLVTPQTPPSQSSSKMDKVEYPVTPTRPRLSSQFGSSSRPTSLISVVSRPGSAAAAYSTPPRSNSATSSSFQGVGASGRSLSPAISLVNGSSGGNSHSHLGMHGSGSGGLGTPINSPGFSSPFSPASSARRTRLVSAPQLEGGLYAKGTVDGLSEELEGLGKGDGVDQNER